ncbi:predicted protein [Postia placenta Mad-698-R]|uniref:Uncharacterized protein n=1 Tax=Postia placenta MAD-698-R-SB12 TaxID=670580 RepID=A0A1X6N2E8_9APHY|nr:hypothetical protein POSPLADRAFT_1141155 [Postia placenta MAD-698-R-SB12]EED77844.1 predicted protein [Postia placenta Mad-698-R]OSX62787.1 hypothetical protein POSPLADRAFT_1141155 [Postia placenta MAD-698-R-SB12]
MAFDFCTPAWALQVFCDAMGLIATSRTTLFYSTMNHAIDGSLLFSSADAQGGWDQSGFQSSQPAILSLGMANDENLRDLDILRLSETRRASDMYYQSASDPTVFQPPQALISTSPNHAASPNNIIDVPMEVKERLVAILRTADLSGDDQLQRLLASLSSPQTVMRLESRSTAQVRSFPHYDPYRPGRPFPSSSHRQPVLPSDYPPASHFRPNFGTGRPPFPHTSYSGLNTQCLDGDQLVQGEIDSNSWSNHPLCQALTPTTPPSPHYFALNMESSIHNASSIPTVIPLEGVAQLPIPSQIIAESPHNSPKPPVCSWDNCGHSLADFHRSEVRRHFRDYHEVQRFTHCRWSGCGIPIKKNGMVKHVTNKHLHMSRYLKDIMSSICMPAPCLYENYD